MLEHVAEKLDYVVGDEFELCQRSLHFNHYAVYGAVNAYRIDGNDGNRLSDTTIVVCNSDLENMNHTLRLNLRPGKYRFLVWADYVVHGTKTDLYYNSVCVFVPDGLASVKARE